MGKSTTSTQQSGPPAQVLQNYEGVYNNAQNVASQPYPTYSGSLLAGFQPQQVAGFNDVNTAANSYQPFLNQASQYANNATSMLAPGSGQETASEYVNPALQTYIDAAGSYNNAALGQAANALNYTNTGIGQAQAALNYTNTGIGEAQSALGQYTNPAMNTATSSLQNYTNPAISRANSSLTNYTNPALGLANSSLGNYTNPAISQGNTAASNLNAQNFGGTVNSYYSPYANAVIAPTEAQFNQQNAVQQSQLTGNAAAQGAFGGDRTAVAQAQLAGQQQMAEAPVIAGLETQGYNQATQNAEAAAGLGMQAAGLTMQGGTQAQNVAGLGLQGGQQAQNVAQIGMQGGQQAQNVAGLQLQGGNQALQAAGMTMAGAQPALQAAGMTMAGAQPALQQAGLTEQAANEQLAEGNLNETGYNSGMSAAQADAWLNSQGSFAMGNLGQEAESLGLTGANAEIGAGGMQQQQAQQELNIPYQQFQAAEGYPYQQTNWLSGIASGLGSLSGQQGSTTQPGPSPVSQIAGLGMAGLGTAGMLGWAPFAASGGRIDNDKLRAIQSLRRDIVLPHRADGGDSDTAFENSLAASLGAASQGSSANGGAVAPPGSPMASNLYSQYASLPTEKLHELAAQMPGNQMIQRALQMRSMQPQTDPSQQQPQPQQMMASPGGFSHGGALRRPDGGIIPGDMSADVLNGLQPTPGLGPQDFIDNGTWDPQNIGGGQNHPGIGASRRPQFGNPQSAMGIANAGLRMLQRPQQQQMQSAPGTFAAGGGVLMRPDGGLIPDDLSSLEMLYGDTSSPSPVGGPVGAPIVGLSGSYGPSAPIAPPMPPSEQQNAPPASAAPTAAGLSMQPITAQNTSSWQGDEPGAPSYGGFQVPSLPPASGLRPPSHVQQSRASAADTSSDQLNQRELDRLQGVSGAPPLAGLGSQQQGDQDFVDNGSWDPQTGGGGEQHTRPHSSVGNFMATPSGMLLAAGLSILGGRSPFASVNIGEGALRGLELGQGAQNQIATQQLRQTEMEGNQQYKLAMARAAQQRADTGTDRATTYAQLSQASSAQKMAAAALEQAKAAHAGASHATEGDVLSSAVSSLANGKEINPDTGQPWTKADALMHVRGVDSMVQRRQAQTDQGDARLAQGDRRLDQGDARLDLRHQAYLETVQQHGIQNDQKSQAMLGQQIKGMSDQAIRIYTASKDPVTGAYLMKPEEAEHIAGGFRGQGSEAQQQPSTQSAQPALADPLGIR